MTRHKRRAAAAGRGGGDGEWIMIVALQFVLDLQHWIQTDPRTTLRIVRLMIEVRREPLRGIGKPEPLKHDLGGFWSRRITDEDRLIYRIGEQRIEFAGARAHYA